MKAWVGTPDPASLCITANIQPGVTSLTGTLQLHKRTAEDLSIFVKVRTGAPPSNRFTSRLPRHSASALANLLPRDGMSA